MLKARGIMSALNLSVAHFGKLVGEGDDMICSMMYYAVYAYRTEDYFNHAWGMQDNAGLYNGTALHSIVPGFQTSYKFHIPILYISKRIRVTIEHGHANHLCDDWASTAYWYQKNQALSLSSL
jgi:hypothetical protein